MAFGVWDLGFRVCGSGFKVQGSGFRIWGGPRRKEAEGKVEGLEVLSPHGALDLVQGSGFRVWGFGFKVLGAGCRVLVAGCRVQGAGCRVQGARSRRRSSALAALPPGETRGMRLTRTARRTAHMISCVNTCNL